MVLVVGGARPMGVLVVTALTALVSAQDARADSYVHPGLPQAQYDRFVRDVGRDRAEALLSDTVDADRERAAGWLGRWVDANRPDALRPVSPTAIPLDDPLASR